MLSKVTVCKLKNGDWGGGVVEVGWGGGGRCMQAFPSTQYNTQTTSALPVNVKLIKLKRGYTVGTVP